MKNLKKRKYIVHDTNYLGSNESFKKFKTNGLTYEFHCPINWYEVKIILDTTVVEKYLKNKKTNGEITTTRGSDTRTKRRDRNAVPNAPQATAMFNSVFSKMNDVMVKLEVSEETRYDHSAERGMFEFINVAVKQEDNAINAGEFEDPMSDDFQCQNYKNPARFAEQLDVERAFENEEAALDGREELEIGLEFKHEPRIPNYENPSELISRKNDDASKKIWSQRSTRSNRRKRKCQACDSNCDHEVVKNKLSSPRVKKNPIKDSNCSNKSKTLPKAQPLQPPAKPQPLQVESIPLFCDICDKTYPRKNVLLKHIEEVHLPSPSQTILRCTICEKNFNTVRLLKQHEFVCLSFVKCKYCLIPIKSRKEMIEHLKVAHTNMFPDGIKYPLFAEFWIQSLKDVLVELERNGNTTKLESFAKKILRVGIYWKQSDSFVHTKELLNTTNNAAASGKPYYNCRVCGYKWTTTAQLYAHIIMHMREKSRFLCPKCYREFSAYWGRKRFERHVELCGIPVHYPCIFCPKTPSRPEGLAVHLNMHYRKGERDMTTEYILQYSKTFKKMVQDLNDRKFNERSKMGTPAGETINDPNYYINGVHSFLQSVCRKCNAVVTHSYDTCFDCRSRLIYQCAQCRKEFPKYFTAWQHVTSTCENRILTLPLHGPSNKELNEPSYFLDHSYALKLTQ